jgi:hypothetical protein
MAAVSLLCGGNGILPNAFHVVPHARWPRLKRNTVVAGYSVEMAAQPAAAPRSLRLRLQMLSPSTPAENAIAA